MVMPVQGSLFDQGERIALRDLDACRRTDLGAGAWVETRPDWVTGADMLFARLAEQVPWRSERRRMYDAVVDVPRWVCFYDEDDPLPDAALDEARERLSARYASELGEPLRTTGLCYYRDGAHSVAWHGDTRGRASSVDTVVAIVSVGAQRPLLLRPRGGGTSRRYRLGHGDLLVMGGSCQRTWEHAVPKTTAPVGGRISIQFRARGVS